MLHCDILTMLMRVWMFCSHVYYMSGDAWKDGGIDCTGTYSLFLSFLSH